MGESAPSGSRERLVSDRHSTLMDSTVRSSLPGRKESVNHVEDEMYGGRDGCGRRWASTEKMRSGCGPVQAKLGVAVVAADARDARGGELLAAAEGCCNRRSWHTTLAFYARTTHSNDGRHPKLSPLSTNVSVSVCLIPTAFYVAIPAFSSLL